MEAVIFQMGKVASTAIAAALRKQKIEAVQAHIATPDRLSRKLQIMAGPNLSEEVAQQVYQDFHQELRVMYLLSRRRVAGESHSEPLLLISPMRDPLTWYWSHFAQMYQHYHPQLLRYFTGAGGKAEDFQPEAAFLQLAEQMFGLLDATNEPLDDPASLPKIQRAARQIDPSKTLPAQINRFLVPLRWYDEDFLPATGVNVYEHAFDEQFGAGEIAVSGFNILLFQYEKLQALEGKLAQFVGKTGLKLTQVNKSEDKEIPFDLKWIQSEGRKLMPASLVDKIYNTRYARHFGYGDTTTDAGARL
jgi:Putative capsular polysaccharide synthesis protein